jgi:thiopurine S-methyltransferase
MEPDFWHERWARGEIGFHQHDFNSHMQQFAGLLGIGPGAHVLVPLCGKSLDMLWLLNQGYRVIGVELSKRAIEDFFTENSLEHRVGNVSGASVFRRERLEIYCADFLNFDLSEIPPVDAVYDRASLVALPEAMRQAYAERLSSLVPAGVKSLLVTLDYPQEEMCGPPFSVSHDEVEALYGEHSDIERIWSEDCLANEPRFKKKGLTRLDEQVYLLSRKAEN